MRITGDANRPDGFFIPVVRGLCYRLHASGSRGCAAPMIGPALASPAITSDDCPPGRRYPSSLMFPTPQHQHPVVLMHRRRAAARHAVLVGLSVLVLLGAGVFGFIAFMRASAPLLGESVHDFGIVPITGKETSFTHTFQLTNNSGEAMYIAGVRPSCGCAGATFSPNIVPPGEVLSIDATLTLGKSGYRDANVEILTAGEYSTKVYIKATGKREMPIWSQRSELFVRPASRGVLDMPILAETYGRSEPPPAPTITVPDQFVVAEVGDWRLLRPEKGTTGEGAQWSLSVRVDYNGLPIANDAHATVSMTYQGKPMEIKVPIRIREQ